MFLTYNQIILVESKAKRRPEDGVVYQRQGLIQGKENETVDQSFWPAFNQAMQRELQSAGMTRYGTIYEDAAGNWCIVPDTWSESEALRAKTYITLA